MPGVRIVGRRANPPVHAAEPTLAPRANARPPYLLAVYLLAVRTLRLILLAVALALLPVGMLFLPPTRRGIARVVTWYERHVTPAGAPPAPLPRSLDRFRLPGLPELETWLNGPPQTADSLRGRVAVIVLWRDTDPQSLWRLLEAQSWHRHLQRSGVAVVGIHLPEFAFAADSSVPAAAVRRLGVTFPIGLDPGLQTWKLLGPSAGMPRVLVVGRDGRIVLDQSGPAESGALDRAITRAVLGERQPARQEGGPPGPHAPVHLGGARVTRGPLAHAPAGLPRAFPAIFRFEVEGESWTPYPVGNWTPGADGVTAADGGASTLMALRYDGPALGVVMSPPASGPVRVWVLRDEGWLDHDDAGADTHFDGRGAAYVMVDQPRLYTIASGGPGEHVVKLSPEQPGVTIYAFTFMAGPVGTPARP